MALKRTTREAVRGSQCFGDSTSVLVPLHGFNHAYSNARHFSVVFPGDFGKFLALAKSDRPLPFNTQGALTEHADEKGGVTHEAVERDVGGLRGCACSRKCRSHREGRFCLGF